MNRYQHFQKRSFDVCLSILGLLVLWPIIILAWLIATLDTGSNGFFYQVRIGRFGEKFNVIKIRTMRNPKNGNSMSTVTTSDDPRITKLGRFFRRTKIDELPQLLNVLKGDMSLVGPRPDVPGFADMLEGDDRLFLSIRPGITGPASIKYKREEELLSKVLDPIAYNREVIFPDKVQINLSYIESWSLKNDIIYILRTITG